MGKTSLSLELAGKTLTLETGQLAQQATASVLARLGDTMVLATVVSGKAREDLGYFPLSVEYVERLYAGGKIKGSRWVKREGRPSDEAILTARLIDRSIRPLFPKEYKNEVQIVVTVLSVDGENEPDVLSVIAVSAALAISPIPWNGPIGVVRVGLVKEQGNGNKKLLINPPTPELELSELDMVVSQTKEKTVMLEADALQVSEEITLQAIEKAQEANREVIAFIEKLVKEVGKKKEEVIPDTMLRELEMRIEKSYKAEVETLVAARAVKESSNDDTSEHLINTILEQEKIANPDLTNDKKLIAKALERVFYKIIRTNILKNGKRPDRRKVDEIRTIASSVSVLPRTHGSAIFQRGTTQALTVVTLGSPRLSQLIESAEGEETKRYMHHYSMPPYSVGETGRIGVPTRREIGHGALAERALLAVVPKQERFPYTIRVVSEVLSSNGSTSMASTCGSTLALMDAGVPLEKPVAGVAMGLMSDENAYVILTDIVGLEDFSGDMDFKVAGTEKGITAMQLDVKISGLTLSQIGEILEKAKIGRLSILEEMLQTIPASRTEVSALAPKIELLHIPVEKIGEVIGPGGKVIKNIIATTGAIVDVEDDGTVAISGTDEEAVRKASDWVKGLTREVQVGEEFEGEVKRILPFGAFVEVLPGKEGMVHVSKMSATEYVKNPSDVVSIGQKVTVKVIEIDEQGRVNLSMVLGKEQPRRIPPDEGRDSRPHRSHEGLEHPLSMQFRRERSENFRKRPGMRSSSSRQPSRFRKSHY